MSLGDVRRSALGQIDWGYHLEGALVGIGGPQKRKGALLPPPGVTASTRWAQPAWLSSRGRGGRATSCPLTEIPSWISMLKPGPFLWGNAAPTRV